MVLPPPPPQQSRAKNNPGCTYNQLLFTPQQQLQQQQLQHQHLRQQQQLLVQHQQLQLQHQRNMLLRERHLCLKQQHRQFQHHYQQQQFQQQHHQQQQKQQKSQQNRKRVSIPDYVATSMDMSPCTTTKRIKLTKENEDSIATSTSALSSTAAAVCSAANYSTSTTWELAISDNEVDYSNDILFCGGGGGNTNEQYEGYIFFKNECKRYSLEYENSTHHTKSKIIDTIIETIQSVNKNGRFLERIKTTTDSRSLGCILWKEIVGCHVHRKFYRAFAILRNDKTNTNKNDTNKTAGKINGMDQKQEDDNTDTNTIILIDINSNNNKNNNNEGNRKRKTNDNANANANENSSSSSNCTSMTTTRTSTKRIKFNNNNEKAKAVARSLLPVVVVVVPPEKNRVMITITKKSVSQYLFYPFFIILY